MSTAPTRTQQIAALEQAWNSDPRWQGIERVYTAEEVVSLRGSVVQKHTLAEHGAAKLWNLVNNEHHVHALGALSGGQAVQMVKAGLKAIYLSGWQVAADGNLAGDVFPDQSLYPANSVPAMVRRLNNALTRADQISWSEGDESIDWFGPIIHEYYAGTEGNGFVYCNSEMWLDHEGTVGAPINCTLHICGDDGEEVPPGVSGTVFSRPYNSPIRSST